MNEGYTYCDNIYVPLKRKYLHLSQECVTRNITMCNDYHQL